MTVFQELYQFFEAGLKDILTTREIQDCWRAVKEDLLLPLQADGAAAKEYNTIPKTVKEAVQQIQSGTPIQYITKTVYFYGLQFRSDKRALIPRPETEELTHWALQDIQSSTERPMSILDVGTGSGCIPIVLKKKHPSHKVSGIDISRDALSLAAENAKAHKVDILLMEANILEWEKNLLRQHQWDIIVSNPPYIPYSERDHMDASVIYHEPSAALFVPDHDPLLFYKTIMAYGKEHLKKGGRIYFECNEFNASEVRQHAIELGYQKVSVKKDLQGKQRMVRMEL